LQVLFLIFFNLTKNLIGYPLPHNPPKNLDRVLGKIWKWKKWKKMEIVKKCRLAGKNGNFLQQRGGAGTCVRISKNFQKKNKNQNFRFFWKKMGFPKISNFSGKKWKW
jgi:hypothetical protein